MIHLSVDRKKKTQCGEWVRDREREKKCIESETFSVFFLSSFSHLFLVNFYILFICACCKCVICRFFVKVAELNIFNTQSPMGIKFQTSFATIRSTNQFSLSPCIHNKIIYQFQMKPNDNWDKSAMIDRGKRMDKQKAAAT